MLLQWRGLATHAIVPFIETFCSIKRDDLTILLRSSIMTESISMSPLRRNRGHTRPSLLAWVRQAPERRYIMPR